MRLADIAFNDSWRALKYVVKACLLSPVDMKRKNAVILHEFIHSYGTNLHNESYQVQNATVKLFLYDCAKKPEIKAAVSVLKLNSFILNIEVAIDTLLAAIALSQNKKVSEISEDETRDIRNRLTVNLIKMFKYLEVMSEITPDGDFDTMIKQINESIQKIETSVKKRTNKGPELEEV